MKNIEIQRLRGISVFLEFLYHLGFVGFGDYVTPKIGFIGVNIFFVISGFVVSSSLFKLFPHEKENFFAIQSDKIIPRLKLFFKRRFFRILPASYFWLIIFVLTAHLIAPFTTHQPRVINYTKEGIAILGGFYNYLVSLNFVHGFLGHYWSLAVEEHFYFVFPFILLFLHHYHLD